jgi:hypothetical protein
VLAGQRQRLQAFTPARFEAQLHNMIATFANEQQRVSHASGAGHGVPASEREK